MGRKATKQYESADEIFRKVGPWGRYQWFLALLYGYHFTIVVTNDGFMSFAGIRPDFLCLDNSTSSEAYNYNNTIVKSTNAHCDLYDNCTDFHYISPFYTIVEEYNLVCDKAVFVNLITSLQFTGIMIGALISGPLVDYYGRKWTFIVVMGLEIALGSLVCLTTSWEAHTAMRFIIGADMNAGWVYLGEFTGNRYRFLFRTVANLVCKLAFPVLGYVTADWRSFELVGNLVCLPILLIVPLLCYESPRWLIQKGRRKEAVAVFRKVAAWNGNTSFTIEEEELPPPPERQREHFWKLFENWRISKYTLCAVFTWFVACLINYGMFFDVGNLPYNVYVTQALLSLFCMLLEFPLALMDTYAPQYINRRLVLLISMGLSAGVNLLVGLLFLTALPKNASLNWIFSLLSIAGQSLINVTFDTAYVYSIELFPTLLRSSAGALCSASARLGAIIAPQLLYVGSRCSSCESVPYLVFGSIGVLGLVVDFFILPNTKDKALLEYVTDEFHVLEEDEAEDVPVTYRVAPGKINIGSDTKY